MKKRLAVCYDGTWSKPDQPNPTNVVKIHKAIVRGVAGDCFQDAFYDAGVGTGMFTRFLGGAFGVGLSKNIRQGYRFLLENYELGDEIYLFGFSRGAYTARSTAGLIRNCGLLKREFASQLEAAYDLYRRRDPDSTPDSPESVAFRKKYSHEPRIKFIGVWDTVGSLGIPVGRVFSRVVNQRWEFHDPRLSRSVDFAYHALAVDERRKPFQPTLWEQNEKPEGQVLEQVWFSGVHSNVGGGYRETGLSDIALEWMMKKAEACGLVLDRKQMEKPLQPDPLGKLENSLKWFYKIISLGGKTREIGKAKLARESVASTAKDRTEKDKSYKPENLLEFLKRPGPPITNVP